MSKEIRELKPCLACGGIMRPIMKYHPSYRQSDLKLLREDSMIFSRMTKFKTWNGKIKTLEHLDWHERDCR